MRVPFRSVAAITAIILVGKPVPLAAQQGPTLCPREDGKSSSNISLHDDDGHRRWRVSWSGAGCSIDMRAEGIFRLKRDLSDVESVSRGGYFEFVHRESGTTRRYEVSDEGNGLERHYFVNRREQPMDDAARRWVAAAILELERRSGFAAEWRVSDLLKDGGPDAVLREVPRIQTDHVQRRYLTILLDSARLTDAQVRSAIRLSSQELGSDYEQASFLVSLGKGGYVTASTAAEYVNATGTIGSDHEKRRALSSVLTLQKLPAAVIVELLRAAGTMRSDHERAELLIAAAKSNGIPAGEARSAYLAAASGLGSDHEKRRVFTRLVESDLSEDHLVALLTSAKSINSDHELATLLVAVAKSHEVDGRVREAYLKAAESIASDHEHRRALSALVRSAGPARM